MGIQLYHNAPLLTVSVRYAVAVLCETMNT